MKYLVLVISLIFIGCEVKQPEPIVITKIVEHNITIPKYLLEVPEVSPMKYDVNGTNDYVNGVLSVKSITGLKKHLIDLYTAYKGCAYQLEQIKLNYGDK